MYWSCSFYCWRTSLGPWKHSHRPWAAFGRIHSAPTGDKLQHLLVGFTGVRHITQREDLPQQYSKRPTGGAAAQQNQPLKLLSAICCIFWYMWIMYFSFVMDSLYELIPCISLACEDALHESLWWHPFDWQHCTSTFPVIAGSVGKILKKAIIYLSEPPLPRLHVMKHYTNICYLLILQTCKCLVPCQSHQFWQPALVQDRWAGNF